MSAQKSGLLSPCQRLPSLSGHYLMAAQNGEGGFEVTYRGTREGDGAEAVINVLKFAKISQWKSLQLFHREAETLRSLGHPRIPQ